MDAAFDIACKYVDDNFDIGDFLDEQDTLTIDDDTFTEDDKITTRTELMGALRSYLKHAIDNEMDGAEYTTDHDVAMMVDEYYPQAEQALKDMGWAIDGEKVEESEQTEKRRFLQFVNSKTGERAESPGKVEVTGKSERDIERIESGMLRNCGSDWYVDDFCDDALDEDTELSNEDVLLPKNEKTDLTREVTNTHEDEPDQDVNRILSLARGKNL